MDSSSDNRGGSWTTQDIDPEALEKLDSIVLPVEEKRKLHNSGVFSKEPVWQTDQLKADPNGKGRGWILTTVLIMVVILIAAYVGLGAQHVESIDDVLKLLSPVQNIVTTALGAAVAFYFSQPKQ